MNYLIVRYIQIVLAVFFLLFTSTSVWAETTTDTQAKKGVEQNKESPEKSETPKNAEQVKKSDTNSEKTKDAEQVKKSDTNSGESKKTHDWQPPEDGLIYGVIIAIVFFSLLTIAYICSYLTKSNKWSLADALSEGYDITAIDANGAPRLEGGKPVLITEMRASTSRVIALMGTIVIVLMFIGFGTFALWGFAKTGDMPASIDLVGKFLLGGLTLFVPYGVNKLSNIFPKT